MPAIKLEKFQGLIPRTSPRLLPPMAATAAVNTKLRSGELRGYRKPREIADFTASGVVPVRRAFRVVDTAGVNPDTWLLFNSRDVDVVRSPLINDAHDRYYWAGENDPRMNTYARIFAGDPGFLLGIPTPVGAPTVTPPGGSDETRAYVYTFVSAYGEEGPPSPPTLATGNAGTWALSNIDASVPQASDRNIAKVRIYRTVSGGSTTSFFFVGEINLGTTTFDDDVASSVVASNNLLESATWVAPPEDLEGVVVMPNGYLVGWVGRRLLFSEPYRPHAWPAEYELSTEFPIVGLTVWGNTLVVGTKSNPYFGYGTHPAAFTSRKLDAVEPCVSRRGMVSTVAGAYYPSSNGIVVVDDNGARVISQGILTRQEWDAYSPANIFAAQLGLQYVAFTSPTRGFVFDPTEPEAVLVNLDGFSDVQGIETDNHSGRVILLTQHRAMEWDPTNTETLNWRWQSKVYQTPEPINFGAVRVMFDVGPDEDEVDITAYYGNYNSDLFAAVNDEPRPRLNTLAGGVLGGRPAQSEGLVADWAEPENRQPLGGSLLYPLHTLSFQSLATRLRIKTGREGTVRFDKVITNEGIYRLPTGFKSDLWQLDLTGNSKVYSVQFGTTPRSLKQV